VEEEKLTFEDGILICKHIYQCAIHKTLNGVIEEWEIFQKSHDMLRKLEYNKSEVMISKLANEFDHKRLDELLFKFNMDNVYATI
jgi:hypothetical protein